jgi:glutathione S-transferase
MPAKYKLIYFKFYDRAEAIRQQLYLAHVDFEDIQLEFYGQEWKDLKPKTPFGQLPVLEFDGHMICQSLNINRFLAQKYGLAGKSQKDRLQSEMISECVLDLINPLDPIFDEPDEEKKEKMTEKYMPQFKQKLESMQKFLDANHRDGHGHHGYNNKHDSGFFVGETMTWTDILWASLLPFMYYMKFGPAIDEFPQLLAVRDKVEAHPRIAEWIKKRPVCPF